jgi:hypothetical protein
MSRKPCTFGAASTCPDGHRHAPDPCKKAVFERYKVVIEKCEIEHADKCPLRRYLAADVMNGTLKGDE